MRKCFNIAKNPFRYFKTSPEIIQLGVLMHVRFPISLRNVQDLLHERGIDVCQESVPLWVDRFGTYFAHKIRKRRSESMRRSRQWQCHLNEVFVKIRGERHYLWRAVNHEGECWNPMSRRSGISLLRDISKESNEAIRESTSSRHGQMIFLSGRNEGHRQ